MSIEKMSLVHIVGSMSNLDATLMKCCESELIHLENPSEFSAKGFHSLHEENPYTEVLQLAVDVMNYLSISPDYEDYSQITLSKDEIKTYLTNLKTQVIQTNNQLAQSKDNLVKHQQILEQLRHLQGLNLKFSDILASKSSVAHFGRLPVDSFLKLEYFSRNNFFFFDYDHDEQYYWGFYVVPNSNAKEVEQIFTSLYFEQIDVSEFADDTPQVEVSLLEQNISQIQEGIVGYEESLQTLTKTEQRKVKQVYCKIKTLNDTFAYRSYVNAVDDRFFLQGFVPTAKVTEFIALFDEIPQVICEQELVEKKSKCNPPVKLKTNWFFRPFEMFVKMYGLPSYHDFDPTSFIGFIYVVLFGIMFGDFGQGFLVTVGGALVWKYKKMPLGAIMSRCGISSMFFGFLYGSCFGFEGCFKPIFNAIGLGGIFPLHVLDPNTSTMLLIMSFGIGIVIILTAIGINTWLGFKKGDYGRAVFSNNGIAGIVFYGGIILAAVLMLVLDINLFHPIFILVVVILPLVLMFFHEPLGKWLGKKRKKYMQKKEEEEKFSAVNSAFEMFDVVLSYCTNTLSFLRVGGFILSHAALMLVVMTFAHMAGSFGSIFVIILGNAFVMALEGLIAGIQVLRLVYYETFSRFYESDGKEFNPARVIFKSEKK